MGTAAIAFSVIEKCNILSSNVASWVISELNKSARLGVGGNPIRKETDGGATEVAAQLKVGSNSDGVGEEKAPLLQVRGGRWSPGVYRSLRLLGRPLEVAWERAFITLPTF